MKPMMSFIENVRPVLPTSEPSFTQRLNRAILIPSVFMFLLVGILLWQISYLLSVTRQVEYIDQVVVKISNTRKLLVDMQTGLRGYLLVGNRQFLEPYANGDKKILASFDEVKELIKGDTQQQERLQEARSRFLDWKAFTVSMIRQQDSNTLVDKRKSIIMIGSPLYQLANQPLSDLQENEEKFRQQCNDTAKGAVPLVILGVLGSAAILGTTLAFLARKELLQLSDKYEEILKTTYDQAEELQQSLAQFRTLCEAMPQIVWATKPNSELEYINQYWYDYTGHTPQENAPISFSQFFYPGDYELTRQAWLESIKTGNPFEMEYRLLRKEDQSYRWHLARGIPLRNEKGEITKWFGTATDIDDQRRTMELLEQSNSDFRALADMVPQMVWRTDQYGALDYINQRWFDYTGTCFEENAGEGWKHALHPEDLERVTITWKQSVRTEQPYCCEYRMRRGNDGTYRWFISRGIPLRNNAGQIVKWFGSNTDIDDKKHAEQLLQDRAYQLFNLAQNLQLTSASLEKRNKELDQFTYVVSHDLKAPLRAIANLSHWIEEDIANHLSEENSQQMQLLRSRVHRMEALINGLLQYSKVGRTENRYAAILVDKLLAEVIDSIDPPTGFQVKIDANMPVITGEAVLLRQVFTNLIGNAIKHHDRSEGTIEVSVQPKGNFYEFAVKDDGPGIDSNFHNKIFVIFQTLKTRETLESTGIGLSIVKKIIESQGGSISVESEVGLGTTFRFTWPTKVVTQTQ